MGRPAGSKNGSAKKAAKKAAGTGRSTPREAPRKQAAAAQPNGPSDSDIQEWLTEATELETQMARVRQKMSTLKKTVENGAGDWRALKATLASTKLSKAEAIAKLEANVRYHRAIQVRVSFDPNGQGSLVDVLADPTPGPVTNESAQERLVAARAHGSGYNDGLLGKTNVDNPHTPGTEEYVEWQKGCTDGAFDRELAAQAKANGASAHQSADSPEF